MLSNFFKGRLLLRIGLRYQWPGLSESKPSLTEQALALSDREFDPKPLANEMRKEFAIPEIGSKPIL